MVCELIQRLCNIIQVWCYEQSLSVNQGKTDLILLMNERRLVSIKLPMLYSIRLELTQQVTYLGILFHKFRWKPHVKKSKQSVVRPWAESEE